VKPLVAATLVGLGLLAGCGAPPEDASAKEFCGQIRRIDRARSWSATQESVNDLEDIGTPRRIPARARAGFEMLVSETGDAASREDLVKAVQGKPKAERAELDAFEDYVAKACAG
jgi:hypothetical protein